MRHVLTVLAIAVSATLVTAGNNYCPSPPSPPHPSSPPSPPSPPIPSGHSHAVSPSSYSSPRHSDRSSPSSSSHSPSSHSGASPSSQSRASPSSHSRAKSSGPPSPASSGCVNSPTNRQCWNGPWGNFDINTDYYENTPNTGKIAEVIDIIRGGLW